MKSRKGTVDDDDWIHSPVRKDFLDKKQRTQHQASIQGHPIFHEELDLGDCVVNVWTFLQHHGPQEKEMMSLVEMNYLL